MNVLKSGWKKANGTCPASSDQVSHQRPDQMKSKSLVLVIYLAAALIRLQINFSQELIAGINGGYYPLQVRCLLENGQLGFADMPLLFYLNAFLVKIISVTGTTVSDQLIITILKLTDSLLFPLIVVPFYRLLRHTAEGIILIFSTAILLLVSMSFQPLILMADLQKNALAVVFAAFYLYYGYRYYEKRAGSDLFSATCFLLATALCHYGTLMFSLVVTIAVLIASYKLRAVVPLLILTGSLLGLAAIFDMARVIRLTGLMGELFARPALLSGHLQPTDILSVTIAIVICILAFIIVRNHRTSFSKTERIVVLSSAICLGVFSFPMLDMEFFRRLSLFAFVLEAIILLFVVRNLNRRQIAIISIALLIYTTVSVAAMLVKSKPASIRKAAYNDLANLGQTVAGDQSIIIARHGLEWWTAFRLGVKVAQAKAIDDTLWKNNVHVFVLHQTDGFGIPPEMSPFREPHLPPAAEKVYESAYFRLYRWDR
jgi:hypothetical protein